MKTDVLVIGGSAAAISAATTGKTFYPEKDFLVLRKEEKVMVPCGIPYIFGTLENSDQNVSPDGGLLKAGIQLIIDEAVSLDLKKKICKTAGNQEIEFDKLILATGSTPKIPGWLKGAELENAFTIPKDKIHLDQTLKKLETLQKIVVLGGGFIGVEMADELNKRDKDVTIVEILPHVLNLAFDADLSIRAEEVLMQRGVKLRTNEGVKEVLGKDKVTGVLLNSGEILDADAVILSTGYQPNVALAEKAGIKINEFGSIKVNEYMRTENFNVFAVGDCAEKFSFITRTLKGIMLASTACAEGRIAGMNLYKLSVVRSFGGTIAIFCTSFGDTSFAAAGVTENLAKERGFDIVTGTFEGIDKHPGTLPDTHKQLVKLIVARDSGIILGGEIIGGPSSGELINLIGLAIENRMTVEAILTSQIGTHPLLTAPPTAYPLMKAAEIAAKKHIFG
ncbi:MAG: FAD-dependent oxidoreductase [bacterium]